ncbi:MAG: cytochrome b/b6 domain-containing protein [Thermodesulfovibrionales bacterium]|nr:cytochrome b/b6 domain-containing protein [Thermodesulfovibrionales bacterium]
MKKKIKRHSLVELIEHWSVAISGLILLFTGLGCLPLYKRYYLTEVVGFGWTANFYNVTLVHYLAAIVFVSAVFFHIFYHGFRGDKELLPKKGDIYKSVKVLAAMIGFGKEPPSDKYLPEQRIAYVGIGLVVLILTISGIVKVLKNLEWLVLSPLLESINTLIHTLFGFIFILSFFIHIVTVVFIRKNWPLLKSMFTGYIEEDYIKERHSLWYEKIKKEENN